MHNPAFTFTHAILRLPSRSVVDGLRAADIGTPDLVQMQIDHQQYSEVWRETGAKIMELPPLAAYPDSVFAEDTALGLPQGAILMRSDAPTRAGEGAQMAPGLGRLDEQGVRIAGPRCSGGDDMRTSGAELRGGW